MSGLDHAVPQEADACPERDDAHAGGGRDLLCAVEGLALNVEVVVGPPMATAAAALNRNRN